MTNISEQIIAIEKEIRETPYHKGTEHHIGMLRARIARLKDRIIESSTRRRQGSGGPAGFALRKQGDATVILIGPPSSGKSTLINKLTNAQSKVAPYAFTTVAVIPGMLKYKEAYIQILDVPGLIEGAGEGKGRGREVLSVARGADLVIFMTDPRRLDFFRKLVKELERAGMRINKTPPLVKIEKKLNGGLMIHTNIKQELDKETIKEVANEFGIKNAQIAVNEKLTMNRLIDAFAKNRVYIPAIYVVNKSDTLKLKEDKKIDPRILRISANEDMGINELKEEIWEKLKFVTIQLIDKPMVVKNNLTLKEVALQIGREFAESKTAAKIWGSAAKFPGQEVSLITKVQDGMKVRFV